MARTWRLDTETKGTGAHVVPLDRAPESEPQTDLATVILERPPRIETPEPVVPLTFKVIDIRSSEVLAEGIDARATIELLDDVQSIVDVRIYVSTRRPSCWRLLTLDEQRTLWQFRGLGG